MKRSPIVLCILDGWGLSENRKGNAVALAKTPHYDRLMAQCPNAQLLTHGADVGLPDGQMGNSEVGHMNIGAGRVVEMDLRRIERVMNGGEILQNDTIRALIDATKKHQGRVHLLGVLSDGGVHGHSDHMRILADALAEEGLKPLLHLFSDGRDVAPGSAERYLAELTNPSSEIATLSGRYYAMDRDNRWDRIAPAFQAMMFGKGQSFGSPQSAIEAERRANRSDEFFKPSVISNYEGMRDGDALICLNYRADRARELLHALLDPEFDAFETEKRARLCFAAGFTSYSQELDHFMTPVFRKPALKNTLPEWVAKHGRRQFRLAETEKYPHVTYFLNGGVERAFEGEERAIIPSPKVATYDLMPEMSAKPVSKRLSEALREDFDLIVVNFANPDMVGHTGDLEAAIKAVEAVDQCLGDMTKMLDTVGGKALICADHGNCENMIDVETGAAHTAHTLNPVPVLLYNHNASLRNGRLCDLAPSLLELMGLDAPSEMTGRSLIT